jgi:hypothetical protein
MILTNLYIAEKAPNRKTRFDVTRSTFDHDFLESLLVSKRDPDKGLSLYLVNRPKKFKGTDVTDKAVTKGSFNISSIYFPDPEIPIAYGDINGTEDAIIFRINPDTKNGITRLEIFVAVGQKHNKRNLYFLFVDGELDHEVDKLVKKVTPF